jgi:hypothetical protein
MLRWHDSLQKYGAEEARMTEGVGGGAAWSQIDLNESDGKGGWLLSTANPTAQTYHLRLTDGTGDPKALRRILGVSQQTAGWAYRFAVEDLPSGEGAEENGKNALVLADIRDASNASHFTVILGTDGSVIVKRGANFHYAGVAWIGGTLLGRSDPCVAAGGYHHFEIKSKIDNSAGFIEIRVNEVTVLNLTGIDTQNTGNATQAQIVVGKAGYGLLNGAGFGTFDLADPFAWDEDDSDPENTVIDFVGDKGCYWLPANGDTAENDHGIVGSVTAYGAVNESPPDGLKYLTSAAPARTILDVAALPGNLAEIISLMPSLRPRKEESGTVLYRGGIVSNGEETYGYEDNPNTEYAYLRPSPKTIDPDTGVPWANSADPQLLIERTE